MRGHPLHWMYTRWLGLWDRCVNPKNVNYHRYGGRGIGVCEQWKDFEVFMEDMGVPEHRGLSLDRVDNDGNYEPGNCRWATAKEQRANQTPRPSRKKPRLTLPDDWLNGC